MPAFLIAANLLLLNEIILIETILDLDEIKINTFLFVIPFDMSKSVFRTIIIIFRYLLLLLHS